MPQFNRSTRTIMTDKVAVITGSNKGIGLGIVRELCERGVKFVYLTSRDIQRGRQAIEDLKKMGLNPEFHQLDISHKNSVKNFADHLKLKHEGLDILINNAAIVPVDFNKTTYEEAENIININFRSYFLIKEYLFPILNKNARVINISSDLGHISNLKNTYWIKRLISDDVKIKDINDFIEWFLTSVKNNTLKAEDFASTVLLSYRISKIAVCTLTRIEQREISNNISINSIHPGFVKTDMTNQNGDLTIEEASQAPVYLALDCDQSVKGKYIWFDKTEKDWTNPNLTLTCHEKEGTEIS